MTTQINVIVDNGGLSAKAKQQTQANRWSKLESDNRQKVGAAGTQQRDANRAQQGIGPNGRPLYGTPASQPLRRDEPAARQLAANKIDMLMVPDQGFSSSGVMPVRSKDPAYGNIVSIEIDGSDIYSRNVPEPIYEPSGGPNATGALRIGGFEVAAYEFAHYTAQMLTTSNGPMFAQGSLSNGQFVLQNATGDIVPVQTKLKAKDCKNITWECFFRFGENDEGSTNRQTVSLRISGELYELDYSKAFRSVYWAFDFDCLFPGSVVNRKGVCEYSVDVYISNGDVEGGIHEYGTDLEIDNQGNYVPWPGPFTNQPLPKLELGEWIHIAFVKSEVGVSLYVKGKRVIHSSLQDIPGTNGGVATVVNEMSRPIIQATIDAVCQMGSDPPDGSPYKLLPVIYHGLRVTPKALYSGDFTPPTSITSYG